MNFYRLLIPSFREMILFRLHPRCQHLVCRVAELPGSAFQVPLLHSRIIRMRHGMDSLNPRIGDAMVFSLETFSGGGGVGGGGGGCCQTLNIFYVVHSLKVENHDREMSPSLSYHTVSRPILTLPPQSTGFISFTWNLPEFLYANASKVTVFLIILFFP